MAFRKLVLFGGWVALLLIGVSQAVVAQPTVADASALQVKIDGIVAPFLARSDFMGVVAVQRDGASPLILPYGRASVELDMPHEASGVFMIGSVSKQFTAAAILLLEEDGLLRTDDTITQHLPAFVNGEQITIEQLLTHTSGVADIYSLKRFGDTAGQEGTFEGVIDDLSRTPLGFPPGSAYAYSNGGYSVLAAIVERVSGMRFGAFLEARIFAPLGMTHTAHDGPGPATHDRVPGYDPWGADALTPVKNVASAFTAGSGSLWSSAADLLVWNAALHNGRLLSEASYLKLTRDYGNGYGYGVSVFQRLGRDVIGHDGRVVGYATDLARYLEDRLTVVILSNVQSVARDEIRWKVAAAVLGEPYSISSPGRTLVEPSFSLTDLVGVYSFGPGFNVSISISDGRLLARANEGGYSELIPSGETEWFSRLLYTTIRFARNEMGVADRLIWGIGDGAPVGQRIQ